MQYGKKVRSVQPLGTALFCAAMTWGLGGCRHKAVVPPLPPVLQPVDLAKVPEPDKAPMIEPPQVKLPPVPTAAAASHPGRTRRKKPTALASTPSTPPPAAAPAPEPPPAPVQQAVIGELTSGSDSGAHVQREAQDLIGSINKRLGGLSTQKLDAEKDQVSRIRNFLRQAQEALTSGDTEGANTLATKAKLLMDDLEK